MERLFGRHQPPENRWAFHYYRVVDRHKRLVLATFFTEALWKDDVLAPPEVSLTAERRRRVDPYYATSKVFTMGSLLTQGSHLFLARDCDWRRALDLLISDVHKRSADAGARAVALRDLPARDEALIGSLERAGFVSIPLPLSWTLRARSDWRTEEEFLSGLKQRRRGKIRNRVFPLNGDYEVRVLRLTGEKPCREELARFYFLYREVHRRSLEVNTFAVPPETFGEALDYPGWEILALDLRHDPSAGKPVTVAVMMCFRGRRHYVSVLVGLDYRYVLSHAAYRQTIWRIILRARELGADRVEFGVGAPVEKERFGCVSEPRVMLYSSVSV